MSDCIDKFDVTMIESKSDAYPEEWNADYERGFGDAITAVLKLPSVHPKLPENWWKTDHGYMWLCPHCGLPVHSDFEECLRCGTKRQSAQPEVIRCKDCSKRPYCRMSTAWAVVPDDDWFCGDAERRTDE